MAKTSLIKDRGDGVYVVDKIVVATYQDCVDAGYSTEYQYMVEDAVGAAIGLAYNPGDGSFSEAVPLLEDAQEIKMAEVKKLSASKIKAVEIDFAGSEFATHDYEEAKLINGLRLTRLDMKKGIDTLDTDELNEGRNLYKMFGYQETCARRVLQARESIMAMTDPVAIMALDAETDVPWPTYPTWS